MLHGWGVGHEYRTALDGYIAEGHHPDDVLVFREILRNGTRGELKEWYELYKDTIKAGETRRIKKKESP